MTMFAMTRLALDKAQAIIAQKMPDPAKGQTFEALSYVDWLHYQALSREAEKVLKEPTTQPVQMRGKS